MGYARSYIGIWCSATGTNCRASLARIYADGTRTTLWEAAWFPTRTVLIVFPVVFRARRVLVEVFEDGGRIGWLCFGLKVCFRGCGGKCVLEVEMFGEFMVVDIWIVKRCDKSEYIAHEFEYCLWMNSVCVLVVKKYIKKVFQLQIHVIIFNLSRTHLLFFDE